MNKKLLIVLGIGLVGAAASTFVFYQLISKHFGEAPVKTEFSVVVAARDVPRGKELSAEDVKSAPWNGEAPPAGSFQDPKAVVGKVVNEDVRYSEPLVESLLVRADESWLAAKIPPGMRGVTVHVTEYAGVTEHLRTGDRVDVLVADGPLSPGNRDLRLRTVLQNVEVLASGRETSDKNRHNKIPAVTLLVDAKDSEMLNLADHSGTVRLALRNPLDHGTEVSQGGKLSDLINGDRAAFQSQSRSAAQRPTETSSRGSVAALRGR